jgi:hypothetical protein
MSRETHLSPELLDDTFDAPLDLGGEHDLRAGSLRMMDLNERGIPVGIAR